MKPSLMLAAASLVCATMASAPARATLVLDLATAGLSTVCSACGSSGTTFGWAFTLHNAIAVTALTAWDADGDGLGSAVDVGLFTASGTLLRSVTIDDGSAHLASASGAGDWLVGQVTRLELQAGDYLIGQVFKDFGPSAQTGATTTSSTWITVTGGVLSNPGDTGLAAPLDAAAEPVFGPSFLAVPEPGSAAVTAAALAALALVRRRQRMGR